VPINPREFAHTLYGQCAEDLFLIQNFFGDRQDGYYVDVGAHHPYRFSNTALLHERGWRGLNIDVDQRAIDAFNEVRPNDTNILCGVAGEAGELTLHLFNEGAVNTLSASVAEEYRQLPGRVVIEERKVEVQPLSVLLSRHVPTGQKIDLMSVDVEGLDEEVLRSNDWSKFRPRVLCVEIHGANMYNIHEQPITLYLKEQGYRPHTVLTITSIFHLTD